MGKDVLIVGAGPAGLVAAINLRREGFKVTVAEQEQQVGGNPDWHPSAHTTPLRDKATWDYIGVDCSPCFFDISEKLLLVMGGNKVDLKRTPDPTYVCERGSRENSLDSFLYRVAVKEGVAFDFGRKIGEDDLRHAPANTILATGLTPAMYNILEKTSSLYMGYHAFHDHPAGRADAAIYMGGLGKEYGYSSACNGIWYVLLFSRNELPRETLEKFEAMLDKFEGKKIEQWRRFVGSSPKSGPELIHKDRFVLTGTLAGFIESNLGFGITGALISGKIAAMAFTDRDKAAAEFHKYTKGIPALIEKRKKGQAGMMFKLGELWFDI